ncbi:MAG: hypothetical protein VX642_05660 [Bdellovibrionota bacterium]|nr:hypothetical protein [Bdellovibrionota bacterium]
MIVVIDDESDFLKALVGLLELEAYEVSGFDNFEVAKSFIFENKNRIKLILCDYHIKEGESIAFLSQLPPEIACCLMSGDDQLEQVKYPIINKPFQFEELFQLIDDNIRSS